MIQSTYPMEIPVDDIGGQENILIQKITTWCHKTNTAQTLLGVGDDAAALFPSGRPILMCSDMMLEGQHWTRDLLSPSDVGHKAIARCLSDIAAMGGRPLGLTVSIALSKALGPQGQEEFLTGFYEGAMAISQKYRAPIVGGDLSQIDGSTAIDIAVVGELFHEGSLWRRSGARPFDLAFVSGPLGAAALAYRSPQDAPAEALHKLRRPEPRLDLAESLHVQVINSVIDISDGLLLDANRICQASGVGLILDADRIPLAGGLAARSDALELALTGGDDYELLLALPDGWARCAYGQSIVKKYGLIEVGRFVGKSELAPDAPLVQVLDQNRKCLHFATLGHDPFCATRPAATPSRNTFRNT